MEIQRRKVKAEGVRFFIEKDGKEIARAYLYLLKNDLHEKPFGFLEDVYVDEAYRGGIYAAALVKMAIRESKERGCYKLIDTSRFGREMLHKFYKAFGFKEHGLEFRMDF